MIDKGIKGNLGHLYPGQEALRLPIAATEGELREQAGEHTLRHINDDDQMTGDAVQGCAQVNIGLDQLIFDCLNLHCLIEHFAAGRIDGIFLVSLVAQIGLISQPIGRRHGEGTYAHLFVVNRVDRVEGLAR